MRAHLIEASAAVTGITSGGVGFFMALQHVDLVLGFISAVLGIVVGMHAVYKIFSRK